MGNTVEGFGQIQIYNVCRLAAVLSFDQLGMTFDKLDNRGASFSEAVLRRRDQVVAV